MRKRKQELFSGECPGRCKCLKISSFTLIELLVVVAIVAILAGMLLPALNQARNRAKEINCTNRMREISKAVFMYADTYDGYVMPFYTLKNHQRFLKTEYKSYSFGMLVIYGFLPGIKKVGESSGDYSILFCPANPNTNLSGTRTTYAWYTGCPTRKASILRFPVKLKDEQIWLFGNANGTLIDVGAATTATVSDNHGTFRSNWARYDGSIKSFDRKELKTAVKDTQQFLVPEEVVL